MVMQFWVFSYNRGEFLKNCISSIEFCAPGCPIRIFDDNSNDPDTCSLLTALAKKYEIFYPKPQNDLQSKHGGLYANMQAAYEACQPDDLVCFLQDDTQLVRKIDAVDLADIEQYFRKNPDAGFLQPAFMRGCNKNTDRKLTRFDASENVYFVDRLKSSAGAFYSDICVFKVDHLRSRNWQYVTREAANEVAARQKFKQMAYLRNPFVAWLPNVPAFRGKTQTWALRWAHKQRSCGYFPIQYLSDEDNGAFRARDNNIFPYAEDHLTTPDSSLSQPWIYYPLQGKSLLKLANSAELRIKRWIG